MTLPNDIFIGLDLGLRRDPSALIALERSVVPLSTTLNHVTYQWETRSQTRYAIVHAERFPLETPFSRVTARTAFLARHCASRASKCLLAMDATGLGIPVIRLMRDEDLGRACFLPVTITDGGRQHFSGDTHKVPNPDLVSGLTAVIESGELAYARGIDVRPLAAEMSTFGARLRPTGHTEYGGPHDDLVLALCLALWASRLADHGPRPVVIPGFPGKDWI
jgi:hypothetical protein